MLASGLVKKTQLNFDSEDLVYGPSAGGALRKLQQRAGGKLLTDIYTGNKPWIEASIEAIEQTVQKGKKIHFDLTHLEDIEGVLKGTGRYANTITGKELRYIRNNWDRLQNMIKFYVNDIEVKPIW